MKYYVMFEKTTEKSNSSVDNNAKGFLYLNTLRRGYGVTTWH